MSEASPFGHLLIANQPPTDEELARQVGVSVRRLRDCLTGLERRQVFSRTADGVIYSRRMVRDEAIRLKRAAGGNDSLNNPNVPRPKDEGKGTQKDILPPILQGLTHIPEVIVYTPETAKTTATALVALRAPNALETALDAVKAKTAIREARVAALHLAADTVFRYWRDRMGKDPDRTRLDGKREARLTARLRENDGDVSELLYAVDGALRDDWLMGRAANSVKKFNDVETIFRDRAQVEKLVEAVRDRNGRHPFLETVSV